MEGITPHPFLLLLRSGSDVTLDLSRHHQNSTVAPGAILDSLKMDFRFSLNAACAFIDHCHGLCLNNPGGKKMEISEWFFISLLLIKDRQCCLGRSSLFGTARMLVFLKQPSVQNTVKNWFVTAQSHFSS